MPAGGRPNHLAGFHLSLFALTARQIEFNVGVSEGNRRTGGVPMPNRLFVRTIMDAQNANARILELNFIMLRIDFHRILCHYWNGDRKKERS